GERFAPEAHRADAEEVVGIRQFARGVASASERQGVRLDPAPVVHDLNAFDAALVEVDFDARTAGVDRILDQFFDHARRPLDHFAGGDLRDHVRRQLADPAHAEILWPDFACPRADPTLSPRGSLGGARLRRYCPVGLGVAWLTMAAVSQPPTRPIVLPELPPAGP